MQYILQLPIEEVIDIVRSGMEEERREQRRQQWTAMLPFMSMGMLKYMSFNEYEEKCSGKNIDMRPAEEIINEIRELHGGKLDGYI